MWNNDLIYKQTYTEVNTLGDRTRTWVQGTSVLCDAQPINKELAFKKWGFTQGDDFYQVFAPPNSGFTKGLQVKLNSIQYLVRLINPHDKMSNNVNHDFMILSRVI